MLTKVNICKSSIQSSQILRWVTLYHLPSVSPPVINFIAVAGPGLAERREGWKEKGSTNTEITIKSAVHTKTSFNKQESARVRKYSTMYLVLKI